MRKMFGGAGLFLNDVMFALIDDETIFLKTDETLAAAMKAEGAVSWIYDAKDRTSRATIGSLPDATLDDPDEAVGLGQASSLRHRGGAKKPKATKKRALKRR